MQPNTGDRFKTPGGQRARETRWPSVPSWPNPRGTAGVPCSRPRIPSRPVLGPTRRADPDTGISA